MIELELWHWQLFTAIATAGIISVVIFAVYAIQRWIEESVKDIVTGNRRLLLAFDDKELGEMVTLHKLMKAKERDGIIQYVKRLK